MFYYLSLKTGKNVADVTWWTILKKKKKKDNEAMGWIVDNGVT